MRRRGDNAHDVASQSARQLRIGAFAQHHDVAVRTRFGQCRAKAVREREHADEHRDHEADAEGRERRRHRPLHDAADVVDDGNHSTCRSAWTTGSRAARSAGTRPLASIKPTATSTPRITVLVVTVNPGRKPAPLKLIAGYSSFAPPSPRAAPVSASAPASTITNANSSRSENPTVLSTAISPVRSRALIIMAFAVTSRIANTTARPIVLIRKLTFPHIVAKLAWNSRSVPVLVGALELRNMSSIALAMAGPCAGSSTSTIYHPAMPARPMRSSKYS